MFSAAESIKAELKKSKKLENGRGKENGKKEKFFDFYGYYSSECCCKKK